MIGFAPAKINIGLHILRKRTDGYHDLETVFCALPGLYDSVECAAAPSDIFTASGLPVDGDCSSNLVWKALMLLRSEYSFPPVHIHLHKVIPMGAGLGGGSSDAACMLRLLNEMFRLGLTADGLRERASRLGSDCAYFVEAGLCLGQGRGEQLRPLDKQLEKKWIALAKPDVHVSTALAYSGVRPHERATGLAELVCTQPIGQWKDRVANDFEKHIFEQFPLIASIKDRLYGHGAAYAAMSGSGSSVFGIFDKKPSLSSFFSNCFYWEGELML